MIQQAYAALTGIRGGLSPFKDSLDILEWPIHELTDVEKKLEIKFENEIKLQNIHFSYETGGRKILEKINLKIIKGSKVGIIGTTGSGKSTVIDVIMGLLEPTNGVLEVDGLILNHSNLRSWQKHIAHVPQNIFLLDGSVEENIALGVPKSQINHRAVRKAAEQAQIAFVIEGMPDKYETIIGEHGVRLSGGQRQRLGIARALYKRADVIIFDEATSSLDSETEQAVMQAIECLSKEITVLIIAHRLTTLKKCTQIVEIGDGGIKRICRYEDIIP